MKIILILNENIKNKLNEKNIKNIKKIKNENLFYLILNNKKKFLNLKEKFPEINLKKFQNYLKEENQNILKLIIESYEIIQIEVNEQFLKDFEEEEEEEEKEEEEEEESKWSIDELRNHFMSLSFNNSNKDDEEKEEKEDLNYKITTIKDDWTLFESKDDSNSSHDSNDWEIIINEEKNQENMIIETKQDEVFRNQIDELNSNDNTKLENKLTSKLSYKDMLLKSTRNSTDLPPNYIIPYHEEKLTTSRQWKPNIIVDKNIGKKSIINLEKSSGNIRIILTSYFYYSLTYSFNHFYLLTFIIIQTKIFLMIMSMIVMKSIRHQNHLQELQ